MTVLDNQDVCPDSQDVCPDSATIRAAAARLVQRCDVLGSCSEDEHRLTRTFCSPAMRQVHDNVKKWMHDAEMTTRVDALANFIGRYYPADNSGPSANSGASGSSGPAANSGPSDSSGPAGGATENANRQPAVFLTGSHLDTVVDAGKFDGPLGVLLGLAAVEVLRAENRTLPFALDVVGFSEEEGVRFNSPFLGSRAIAGSFDPSLFDAKDVDGCTMRQALIDFGVEPDEYPKARYDPASLVGFIELHMEQGPVLEQAGHGIGAVSAIAGQTRTAFVFRGLAGHAGTVPHEVRHDSLAAAAEFITRVEQLGRDTSGLFATVGDICAYPNVSNVIPGETRVRLDLRHDEDATRLEAYATIQKLAEGCASRRGVTVEAIDCEQQAAVPMDKALTDQLESVCKEVGAASNSMISGAGHDAVVLAPVTPTAMLFVRCRGGLSHHPDEYVDVEDVALALDALVRFLLKIDV